MSFQISGINTYTLRLILNNDDPKTMKDQSVFDFLVNREYYSDSINEDLFEEQALLLENRAFEFSLFIQKLDFNLLYFPISFVPDKKGRVLLVSQIIKYERIDKTKLLDPDDSHWKDFLQMIEEAAIDLNNFLSFYKKFTPVNRNPKLKNTPLYQNRRLVTRYLYKISQVFKEVSTLHAEFIDKSVLDFNAEDKEKVTLITKKIVWGELELEKVRIYSELISEEKIQSDNYYLRYYPSPDPKKVRFPW